MAQFPQMARPGLKPNMHYKTSEERQEICRKYISHLREGLSIRSFEVSPVSMDSYIRNFSEDFPELEINKAFAEQRKVWERHGIEQSAGRLKDGKHSMTMFGLKNIVGWEDRIVTEDKTPEKTSVNSEQRMLDMALKIAFVLHSGVKTKEASIINQIPRAQETNDGMDPGSQTTGD